MHAGSIDNSDVDKVAMFFSVTLVDFIKCNAPLVRVHESDNFTSLPIYSKQSCAANNGLAIFDKRRLMLCCCQSE